MRFFASLRNTPIVLAFCLVSFAAYAAEPTKPMSMDDVKKLQESLGTAQHIKVNFDMIQHRKLRKVPIKKIGTAQFAKPNMFLWTLESNPKSIQAFDGKKFTRYTPDKNEAQVFSAKGEEFQSIARIIDMVLDFGALLKDYDIVSKNWEGSMAVIVLKPKVKDSDISDVQLTVSSQFSFVKNIKMNFYSGNTTEISFKNLARQKLDPKVFALSLPKGVKVIDIK